MNPEDCPKLDDCYKVKMILDKDLLDFQCAEAIRAVCAKCSEVYQGAKRPSRPRGEARMTPDNKNDLGKILKQQRLMIPLTRHELAAMSGVSASHIHRIERGGRFPSARILHKVSKPLGFEENELFMLAGYLSPQASITEIETGTGRLDPYVARVLAQEPVDVQRTVIGILTILKSLGRALPTSPSLTDEGI